MRTPALLLTPHTMDGPNYFELFQRCPTNLPAEIVVRYLRFFKDSDKYQDFLLHYVPLLPEDVRDEFLKDIDDKDKKKDVKAEIKETESTKEEPEVPAEQPVTETTTVEVASDTSEPVTEDSSVALDEVPAEQPKKRGRKPKTSTQD